MCFLLIHHRTYADHPLVLLANRDEYFDRPFEPPALRDEQWGLVAPRDQRAGGTWLGVNRHGLVAAITNRDPDDIDATGLRSRGLLVTDALRHEHARDAAAWWRGHDERYAGFNLFIGDGADAYVIQNGPLLPDGEGVFSTTLALPPGVHVLTNLHDLDKVTIPLAGRPISGESLTDTLTRLERLAADDQTPLPGNHRILKRGRGRGTVCSAVLAQPLDPAVERVFRFADGVPGEVAFASVRA